MKILLLGKDGQVGWELQRALAPLGEVIALDRQGENGLCGDLADLDGLRTTIRRLQPDVIVNAAAYTAVDKAEDEPELACLINALAPQVMAEEMHALNGWLVHYSTDYVFDGSGTLPWSEMDRTAPLNQYGQSKFQGEEAIQQSGCQHLIFRTSWVYAARGNNFAKTMLRLAAEREQLNVIDDQVGAPTGADLLADVTAHTLRLAVAKPQLSGLYHLAAAGETSWCGYARYVIELTRGMGAALAVQNIEPIPTTAYPTPAQRPLNSRLDTRKVSQSFALHLPSWQSGVSRMLKEI
ncbi:dTDP-4-dehydrorhamnose reductase [Pseudomonas sp. EL_65y_Pfl2_R95]|uniref:dTDP-4-dehydrorhamnose reductase n=1 Tax=Pseudomonas sp. EL_65y_Pfl2_R95 TaxID=3088698 RepID=UPI0030DB2FE0